MVAGTGDWSGDGSGDFAVWSQETSYPFTYHGHVEVYSGSDASVLFSYTGAAGSLQLHETLGVGGDVNGDGVLDLAIPIDLQTVSLPDGQNYLHAVQAGETIMWQYWHGNNSTNSGIFRFSSAVAVPFQ
ncbi:MAG: hypothetical protein ACI8QC_001036 [Planctomycetota bacterium]